MRKLFIALGFVLLSFAYYVGFLWLTYLWHEVSEPKLPEWTEKDEKEFKELKVATEHDAFWEAEDAVGTFPV